MFNLIPIFFFYIQYFTKKWIPPGTGKTLMARQIGKMLNSREPKIVNGPEILDKYVGESEANVRRLFAEAEEEEKRLGPNSGETFYVFFYLLVKNFHVFIF